MGNKIKKKITMKKLNDFISTYENSFIESGKINDEILRKLIPFNDMHESKSISVYSIIISLNSIEIITAVIQKMKGHHCSLVVKAVWLYLLLILKGNKFLYHISVVKSILA